MKRILLTVLLFFTVHSARAERWVTPRPGVFITANCYSGRHVISGRWTGTGAGIYGVAPCFGTTISAYRPFSPGYSAGVSTGFYYRIFVSIPNGKVIAGVR